MDIKSVVKAYGAVIELEKDLLKVCQFVATLKGSGDEPLKVLFVNENTVSFEYYSNVYCSCGVAYFPTEFLEMNESEIEKTYLKNSSLSKIDFNITN